MLLFGFVRSAICWNFHYLVPIDVAVSVKKIIPISDDASSENPPKKLQFSPLYLKYEIIFSYFALFFALF
jgi:hypothetical protein